MSQLSRPRVAAIGIASVAALLLAACASNGASAPQTTAAPPATQATSGSATSGGSSSSSSACVSEAASRTLGAAWDEVADEARENAQADPKQQVVVPTADATAAWRKIVAPVTVDWAKDTPGGDKVLTAFHTYLAQVAAGQ